MYGQNGQNGQRIPQCNDNRRLANNDRVPQIANGTLEARHVINAIPICDGSPVSISKFTRSLRHISANLHPNEQRNLLILLGGRLVGVALDHYYRNVSEYNTIEDLIADFKYRFGDNINIAKLLGNIRNERMFQGDTVSHFADRIESAVSRAKCQLDNNAEFGPQQIDTLMDLVDSTALEHFLDFLLPDLEVRTKIMRPETLPTAITAAIEVEAKLRNNNIDCANFTKGRFTKNYPDQSFYCVIHGNCNHDTDQCRELSNMVSQRNTLRRATPNFEPYRNFEKNFDDNNYDILLQHSRNNYNPNEYNRGYNNPSNNQNLDDHNSNRGRYNYSGDTSQINRSRLNYQDTYRPQNEIFPKNGEMAR